MESQIIDNLLTNQHDIQQMELDDVINCIMIISIQMYAFNELFEGNDLIGDVEYVDNVEFKSNENDLLNAGNVAKQLHPILTALNYEIDRRQIDEETYNIIWDKCVTKYASSKGINLP